MNTVDQAVARLGRSHPWLANDLASEACLATIEADREGFDDEWVRDRLERFADHERRMRARPIPRNMTEQNKPVAVRTKVPSHLTDGQKRRFLRDALIQLAKQHGYSDAALSVVFALPRSRVSSIARADLHARCQPKVNATCHVSPERYS